MNIHIPTPLRSFTAGAETVAVPGAYRRRGLHQPHHPVPRAPAAALQHRGQAPLLRQRLPQRRRPPLPPLQRSHHRRRNRRAHHHPLHRRRCWPHGRKRFARRLLSVAVVPSSSSTPSRKFSNKIGRHSEAKPKNPCISFAPPEIPSEPMTYRTGDASIPFGSHPSQSEGKNQH